MPEGRVHARPARTRAREDLLFDLGITCEDIERQRFGTGVYESNRFVDATNRQHGEDRTEDLVAHDRCLGRYIAQDRRGDVALRLVDLAPDHSLPILQENGESTVMSFVHDAPEVGRALRVIPVEFAQGTLQSVEQFRLARLVYQHVIGGDAGLASVEELAPRDASGGDLQIDVAIHDARTLATELQRHRRELLRGGLHDDPADASIPRVEDVVKSLLEKCAGLVDTSLDERNTACVEIPRDEATQQFRDVRCDLRG